MPNQSIVNMFHLKANEIQVTDSDLTKWVKKTLFPIQKNTNSPPSPIDLGRFGLKNAAEVVSFLKTHTGKMMESEMMAYAQLESAKQEHRLLEELLLQRLMASLALSFAKEESEEDARKRVDVVNTQADKLAKETKPSTAPLPIISLPEIINQLTQCKAEYDEAIVELKKQTKVNQEEQISINQKLSEITEKKKETEGIYKALINKVNENPSREGLIDDINRLSQKIAARAPTPAEEKTANQIRMDREYAEELELLLRKEQLAEQDKMGFYVDSNHTLVPAREATYFYSRTAQIHIIDNTVFLLLPGQDPELLNQNSAAKADARRRALESKPTQTVYKRVKEIETQDSEFYGRTIADFHSQLDKLQKAQAERDELQHSFEQASKQIESIIRMASAMGNTPRPKAKPSETKPSLSPDRQKFINELEKQLKTQPPNIVYDFIQENAPQEDSFFLIAYMNKNLINKMTKRTPLSQTEQDSFLQYAKKRGVQSDMIRSLNERQEENHWQAPSPLPKTPLDKK